MTPSGFMHVFHEVRLPTGRLPGFDSRTIHLINLSMIVRQMSEKKMDEEQTSSKLNPFVSGTHK
jgi:hypothetical protein